MWPETRSQGKQEGTMSRDCVKWHKFWLGWGRGIVGSRLCGRGLRLQEDPVHFVTAETTGNYVYKMGISESQSFVPSPPALFIFTSCFVSLYLSNCKSNRLPLEKIKKKHRNVIMMLHIQTFFCVWQMISLICIPVPYGRYYANNPILQIRERLSDWSTAAHRRYTWAWTQSKPRLHPEAAFNVSSESVLYPKVIHIHCSILSFLAYYLFVSTFLCYWKSSITRMLNSSVELPSVMSCPPNVGLWGCYQFFSNMRRCCIV